MKTEGSSPKTHSGTASELGKLFRDDLDRKLISKFTDVRELREKADYDIQKDFIREDVEEVVEIAEKFIQEVKDYLR